MKRRQAGVLVLALSAGWLAGCAIDNAQMSKSELQVERQNIIYTFEAAVGTATNLCQNGQQTIGEGLNDVRVFLYRSQVQSYNDAQADLKERGYKGPDDYPEKITDYYRPGRTDWCQVQQKVTGLRCADDL